MLPLFILPILSGLIAQALKPVLNKSWYAKLSEDGRKIPRYGGMPSAHTAFAISLATLVAVTDGIATTSFAITAALVIFVLDDALRMRIFLSRHGEALHKLIEQQPAKQQSKFPHLESRLGHKLSEVIAGGLLGFVVTIVLLWLLP